MANSTNTVYIITRAVRQNNGSFEKDPDTVWWSKEGAKAELKRIKDNYNTNNPDCRARTPLGQPDDLTIETLVGNIFQCKAFYKIIKKDVH